MSDPKTRKVSTDPGLGRAAHTDPGAPTELLDNALEGFAGKLPPVAVQTAESDGREAAKYQSPPRVPPAPNTLPPAAPVIVAKPADIDSPPQRSASQTGGRGRDPSQRRARDIVDHKPPPVTTDPATPKAKRSILPVVLLSAAVLLIAVVAAIAWPKHEATVPSLASGSVPTAAATPSSSSQAVIPSHSAMTPATASTPAVTASAKAPTTHAPSAQRPVLGLAPSSTPSADPIPPEFDLLKPK